MIFRNRKVLQTIFASSLQVSLAVADTDPCAQQLRTAEQLRNDLEQVRASAYLEGQNEIPEDLLADVGDAAIQNITNNVKSTLSTREVEAKESTHVDENRKEYLNGQTANLNKGLSQLSAISESLSKLRVECEQNKAVLETLNKLNGKTASTTAFGDFMASLGEGQSPEMKRLDGLLKSNLPDLASHLAEGLRGIGVKEESVTGLAATLEAMRRPPTVVDAKGTQWNSTRANTNPENLVPWVQENGLWRRATPQEIADVNGKNPAARHVSWWTPDTMALDLNDPRNSNLVGVNGNAKNFEGLQTQTSPIQLTNLTPARAPTPPRGNPSGAPNPAASSTPPLRTLANGVEITQNGQTTFLPYYAGIGNNSYFWASNNAGEQRLVQIDFETGQIRNTPGTTLSGNRLTSTIARVEPPASSPVAAVVGQALNSGNPSPQQRLLNFTYYANAAPAANQPSAAPVADSSGPSRRPTVRIPTGFFRRRR